MKLLVLAATTAATICTASMAFAASTVSHNWTFDTDASSVVSSAGTGNATIEPDEFGTGWYDSMLGDAETPAIYGSAQGWWDIGTGSITLDIPNASGEAQNVVIGITYWKDISQAPDVQFASASLVGKTTIEGEKGDVGGGWYTDVLSWYLRPSADPVISISILGAQNIDPEQMSFGSQIDKISVTATNAVPEPGSLVTLCSGVIGAFGVAFRKKRA